MILIQRTWAQLNFQGLKARRNSTNFQNFSMTKLSNTRLFSLLSPNITSFHFFLHTSILFFPGFPIFCSFYREFVPRFNIRRFVSLNFKIVCNRLIYRLSLAVEPEHIKALSTTLTALYNEKLKSSKVSGKLVLHNMYFKYPSLGLPSKNYFN